MGHKKMTRKVLIVTVLVLMLFSLTSCKTVQGIGKDIQWVGEKGEQAIER
jgi:predicted small secreted protein